MPKDETEFHLCSNPFCPDQFCRIVGRTKRLKSMVLLNAPSVLTQDFLKSLKQGVADIEKAIKKKKITVSVKTNDKSVRRFQGLEEV